MDLNPIKDAFDRVTKKQKLSSSKAQEVIDQIMQEIETTLANMESEILSSPSDSKALLTELKNKLKEVTPLGQLESTQKELNVALSKYPKQLERTFNPDIAKAYRNIEFDSHSLNQIIASHFYRQGLFEIGDCFVTEASEDPDLALAARTLFSEMHTILEAVKNRNLEPAIAWASANSDKLRENESDLQLKLHRLQFVEILQTRGRKEALVYARANIAPYANNHFVELQKIMACLLWSGKLDRSPYTDLLSPENWSSVAEEVTSQFCSLIGQSSSAESPLGVTVAAGFQSLPPLLKFMTVMAGRKQQEWQTMKQLPVPVELDGQFQFHSVFVCPVSKEQSTDENPPMLMSCGHVLCKQSVNKMSKNNAKTFKCPYCPTEIESSKCQQLHL